MEKATLVILILAGLYAACLSTEALISRRDRKKLKHVIYVNGTRGKSTVTRMITAGLRAGGYTVFGKSTGTLPMLLHTDGTVTEIARRALANIREQLRVLHQAAREGAEILVAECMALAPELQSVSGRRMLRADIGVITNARVDHTDVMGETREEVLEVLMEMLPEKGRVFTAERDLFDRIEKKAARLRSAAVLALPEEAQDLSDLDFPENAALALAVCEALGVPREKAAEGIRAFVRDPYDLKVYRKGQLIVINAFSANDVSSTETIYREVSGGAEKRLILLINHREDRPARALEMLRLAGLLRPEEIWLMGEQLGALERAAKKRCPGVRLRTFGSAAEVPLAESAALTQPVTILAVGNIRGRGMDFSKRLDAELTTVPRVRYGTDIRRGEE